MTKKKQIFRSQTQPCVECKILLYFCHWHLFSSKTAFRHYFWDFKNRSCGRRSGLMVSALDSGLSAPGSSPGQGHCIVFLGKTCYSHSVSLHPGVLHDAQNFPNISGLLDNQLVKSYFLNSILGVVCRGGS